MMQDRESADDTVALVHNDPLLRIVPNGIYMIGKLLRKTGFEDLRFSLDVQIVDLFSKFVDALQLIFLCKSNHKYSFRNRRYFSCSSAYMRIFSFTA